MELTLTTEVLSPKELKKQQRLEKQREQAIKAGDWYLWGHILFPVIVFPLSFFTTLLDSLPNAAFTSACLSFLVIDRNCLKLRGIKPPHWGWIILSLPYIWQRCTIMQKGRRTFWIATAMFVLQLSLVGLFIPFAANTYTDAKETIPLVATIMLKEPNVPAPYQGAKCITFSSFSQFVDGKMICTLDNGKKISISTYDDETGETFFTWEPYP